MGLIKHNEYEDKAVPEQEQVVEREVRVIEPLSDDTAQIVARVLAILENLNVEYIRITKGKIEYEHYPDYKSE
jgi:hypothetical protein